MKKFYEGSYTPFEGKSNINIFMLYFIVNFYVFVDPSRKAIKVDTIDIEGIDSYVRTNLYELYGQI